FLPFGFLVYSLIGYFYFHDFLWLIHQSQNFFNEGYPGMKGELIHYPRMYKEIWGTSLFLLLFVGFINASYKVYFGFSKKNKTHLFPEEIVLIYGSFIACLLIHILSYSLPGLINNLGMTRYMVTLIPSSVLIALNGLNFILNYIKENSKLKMFVAVFFSIFILVSPFTQKYFPFKLDTELKLTKETADWMKNNALTYSKLCYFPVAFPLFYEIDPFDNKNIINGINSNRQLPSDYFHTGNLIIWDAHYGGYEARISNEKLDANEALKLIKKFKPENKLILFGKYEFEIRIYKVK
ncbi:MAG: hypothetical protein ABI855_12910, partial [Bacteroidota bacterium]